MGCGPSNTDVLDALGVYEDVSVKLPVQVVGSDTLVVPRTEDLRLITERHLLPQGTVLATESESQFRIAKSRPAYEGSDKLFLVDGAGFLWLIEGKKDLDVSVAKRRNRRVTKRSEFEEAGEKRIYVEFEYDLEPTIASLDGRTRRMSGRGEIRYDVREQDWVRQRKPHLSDEWQIISWIKEL